jgi:hypothetical protein
MGSFRWLIIHAFALGTALVASPRVTCADVLVLDACMEKCNEADWLAIHNLRLAFQSEIQNRALIASVDSMIWRLGDKVPFPGIDDADLTVETLAKHLKDGINKWIGGEYENAAKTLKMALAEAAMNPAIVVADPTLRPLIQRAYVARAVSLFRLDRKDEAKDAIADLVRMTPQPSILDTWGTIPDKVFQLSRQDLQIRGTGSLSIQISDPNAVFYLNAAGQPHRSAFAADMLPGVYQVFVTDTAKRSRRYRVEVIPREHTVLTIDWHRDSTLEVSVPRFTSTGQPLPARRPRIGFTFPSFEERRFESALAGSVAEQVPGSLVLVVGRVMWDDQDAMLGAMYAPNQPPVRVGLVHGNDLDAARDLVKFLMTDQPAPGVTRLAVPPWDPSSAQEGGRLSSSTSRILIGAGAGAIAAGVSLYAINRGLGTHTAAYGVGLGIVGVAAVGAGFWFGRSSAGGLLVSVGGSHAMIGWAGTF